MKMIKRGIAFCLVIMLLMGIAFDNGFAIMNQVKAADEVVENTETEGTAQPETEAVGDTAENTVENTDAVAETTEKYTTEDLTAESYALEEPAMQEMSTDETVTETPASETPTADGTVTEEPAAEESTQTEQMPETKKQDAMELKQEVRDQDGNVVMTVVANIAEDTFDANTSEVSMKVSEVDASLTKTITELAKERLAADKELGSYFLYKVEFQVNGTTVEPGKEVELIFQPTDYKVDDVKKANVFYYNEAYSTAGNQAEEIVEIIQKADQIEELQNAGASIENIDEEYDLTEITLHNNGNADKIITEGRRSTVYGCYLEEQKPEEVTGGTTEETQAEETDANTENQQPEKKRAITLKTTSDNGIQNAEMRAGSSPAFTIYWYDKDGANYSKDSVKVYYVDEEGNPLDEKVSLQDKNEYGTDSPVTIADAYATEIPGYTYSKAKVAASPEAALMATEIYKLRLKWSVSLLGVTYKIQYSTKGTYVDEVWNNVPDDEAVYLVYTKNSSGGGSTGGGSSATGNLAHRKYVEPRDDGTFDLTLDVTGAIGTEENPAKVDVVFVLDLSGSMEGENIKAAQSAVSTLTTNVSTNKMLDSKWKLVTFSRGAEIKTEEWISAEDINQIVQGYGNGSCAGGTNYEAGLTQAGNAINTARDGAVKIVIFLTDGEPTYHGVSDKGGGSKTSKEDYEGALTGAETITCDRFYAVGMGLPDRVYRPEETEEYLSGLDVLTNVANATKSSTKQAINVGEGESLDDVFNAISGSITNYTAKNVKIEDTLTNEVDPVDPSKLVVKVLDKDKKDVTTTEQQAGSIQAVYDQETKKVRLDFADDYELKDGYTYSVTVNIKTNQNAITKYEQNNYTYPDTGETDTGATSAGQKGIYSNVENAAKVTWTTNNENKEGAYNRPVVQIPTEDIPVEQKKEPVNFFLNLSSSILDTDGNIGGWLAEAFTTSVSGSFSEKKSDQGIGVAINAGLRVVVPQDHDHNKQTSGGVYGVIGGTSETNAKAVDEKIRELKHGTNGNQSGTTDETYQIVDENGNPAFPTDEEIFQYIKDNWGPSGTGVNKGKDITVNGVPINKDKLTTDNFAIRWYVFKDHKGTEYWHIDGILVPKSGILTVTKTFPNQEIVQEVHNQFKIKVTGDFLGDSASTTIEKTLEDAGEPVINEDGTITFTWNLAVFGPQYTVEEEGYNPGSNSKWEYESTEWTYTNSKDAVSEGKTTSATVTTERTAEDESAKTQTLAFTNNYSSKNEDTLPYISVSKTFKGLSSNQISKLASQFSLIVEKNEDKNFIKVLRLDDKDVIVTPEFILNDVIQDYTYTWKVEGCTTGSYTVTETGENVDEYDVTTDGIGNDVTVTEGNWTFDPNIQEVTSNSETDFKMASDGIIMATLKANGGYLIWTNQRLSVTQKSAVIDAINTLEELKTFKTGEATVENTRFYYGDSLKEGITISDGTLKYDPESGKLSFSEKSLWKHLCTGTYSMTGKQNADIVVTNSYQEQKTAIDLVKHGTTYDNDNVLDGAKFTLYEGTLSGETMSWEENPVQGYEGFAVSSTEIELDLPAGYYKLKEIEAPVGYHLLNQEIAFKVENRNVSLIDPTTGKVINTEPEMWKLVNEEGKIVLHIKNEMIYELPQSGGTGIYWYLFGGVLLMMSASLIVYKKRRREVLERK